MAGATTIVQMVSMGREGCSACWRSEGHGMGLNQELPSSVVGEVCAEWDGTGAVEKALPVGHQWASLGISGHQRKHQTPLGIPGHHWAVLRSTGYDRHPWESMGITGHYWASLNIVGHLWALLNITGHNWAF